MKITTYKKHQIANVGISYYIKVPGDTSPWAHDGSDIYGGNTMVNAKRVINNLITSKGI